ncbi:MAG: putative baseplate assembly protein [Blastocatellia bacterium]
MKCGPAKQSPENCGCCEGIDVLTPVANFNRPGLDAIAYRVGAHGSFLETMKAHLSSSEFPRLVGLTTRDGDDASIALLDAWATVADVLTFYQERVANEGYLRTATERRSILELARLIGYRLKPGVAASVYLAYTIETTQEKTTIEAGNRAQSIPGPGELPQVFETAERLEALSALNALKPRLTQPHIFSSASEVDRGLTIYLQGTSTNLRVNDVLLLSFTRRAVPSPKFYRVEKITPEAELNRTIADLSFPPDTQATVISRGAVSETASPSLVPSIREMAEKHLQTTPAGKIAARVKVRLEELSGSSGRPEELIKQVEEETLPALEAEHSAIAANPRFNTVASWLAVMIMDFKKAVAESAAEAPPSNGATTNGAAAPAFIEHGETYDEPSTPNFGKFLTPFALTPSVQPPNETRLRRQFGQIYDARSGFVPNLFASLKPQIAPFVNAALLNALSAPISRGPVELSKVETPRQKAALAGHSLPTVVETTIDAQGIATTRPLSPPTLLEYLNSLAEAGFEDSKAIALDAEYDLIKSGTSIAITRPVIPGPNENGRIKFTTSTHNVTNAQTVLLTFSRVSLKVTVLTLDTEWLPASERQGAAVESRAQVRSTTVYAQSENLTPAERPINAEIRFAEGEPNPVIELDNFYPSLESGRWAIISGVRMIPDEDDDTKLIDTGVRVAELLMIASVTHEAKTLFDNQKIDDEKLHTFIKLAEPPAYIYKRDTVKIYGNIVRATHGQTQDEVLGSGDGSQKLQSFQLKQSPLTYLAAPTPTGTESTLEVRVNDVLWHEAGNLFTLGQNDRNYITKTGDDAKTTVVFGNGERGARLPTGSENVKAVYRFGIGKPGNVSAEQIKLPLTRPLGVKDVINPLPASGGADRETRDQARRNAPIGTLALDRLVSVQDYADFARTFAGIGKASARRLSDGFREVVHLTIAGAGDVLIDQTSDLYRNLILALKRFGDPSLPFEVDVFERVLLVISAKLKIHPDYLLESVKPKIKEALLEKLEFDSRELGQDVTQSEVISVIQSVPGVIYVDLELLDSVDEAKLLDPNFDLATELKKRKRVNSELARFDKDEGEIKPAQLVFLPLAVKDALKDTLILEEVSQ